MESTVVDISITPPSFKPVSLYLSRSSPFKTPKQVFFNPMHILDTFTTLFLLYIIINFYFFHFNVNFFIRLLKDKTNLTEQRQREKKSENN